MASRYAIARECAGLSLGQACRILDIRRDVLRGVERGKTAPPRLHRLLADLYRVSSRWLDGETPSLPPASVALLDGIEDDDDRAKVRLLMEMMALSTIVLVTGGRNYWGMAATEVVYSALDLLRPSVVIHGAAKGADTLAHNWCVASGTFELAAPIHGKTWERYGKAAGMARNRLMRRTAEGLWTTSDRLVCVHFPGGRGTAGMVRDVRKNGCDAWEVVNGLELAQR